MAAMNLRTLAKDYANGVLGLQDYRKARNELIEGILGGRVQVGTNDFQAPLNVQRAETAPDITAFRAPATNKQASIPAAAITEPDTHSTNTHATHRGILVGIAVIIICLVILVALYPVIQQKKTASSANNQITAPDAGQPDTQLLVTLNAGEKLIKQFLAQNEWADENLQQFISQWLALSAEEQDAGLSSPVRAQLVNAMHRKLLEERSMLALGDKQMSIDRQTALVNFARQMGISDPRFTVQDAP